MIGSIFYSKSSPSARKKDWEKTNTKISHQKRKAVCIVVLKIQSHVYFHLVYIYIQSNERQSHTSLQMNLVNDLHRANNPQTAIAACTHDLRESET